LAAARTRRSASKTAPGEESAQAEKRNEIKQSVTVHDAPPLAPDADVHASRKRHGIRYVAEFLSIRRVLR